MWKSLAVVWSCLLLAAVFGATDLRVSSNGHYIETTSGTPWLYLQDTEWIINKHPDAEIISLLNDRQAKGFTVIKISTAGLNYAYGVDSRDYNGNLWYDNNSVTQLNTAFWARILWIADQCAARNLWLEATIGWPGRKEGSPVCQNNPDCYAYGRVVGEKLKDKANIIFNIGCDMHGNAGVGVDGWRAIAEGVADGVNGVNSYNSSADYSTTFMTFHPGGSSPYTSSTWFQADTWLDVNGMEVWHDYAQIYGAVNADYNKTNPVKPTLMLEGSYEGDTNPGVISAHYVRVEAWHSFFAGGFYGYGHVHCYDQSANFSYMSAIGSTQMGYLAGFMKAREWWKFVPDQGMIASGVGSGATRLAAVKSTDGDECYIYYPGVTAAGMVMNRITTSGSVNANWFDPRNNSTQTAGTYTTAQTVTLTPPAGWEDAVLCLNAGDVNQVAAPSISPNGGSFEDSVLVSLSCATSGATIRYTTNGSDPTSTSMAYTAPFKLTATATVKARAFKSGLTESAVASAVFTKAAAGSGPVGWWKFDETGGTTAADASGHGNTGTLTNGPAWTTGKAGGGLSFDGVNDYVAVSNGAAYNGLKGQMTVSVWIYNRALVNGAIIGRRYGTGYEDNWLLYYGSDAEKKYSFGTRTAAAVYMAGAASTGDLNRWVHLAGVYNGTSLLLYRNGGQMASAAQSGSIPDESSPLVMGGGDNGTNGYSEYVNCILDDVRIYDYALSASAVAALYNGSTVLDDRRPAASVRPGPSVMVTPSPVRSRCDIAITGQDPRTVKGISIYTPDNKLVKQVSVSRGPAVYSWDTRDRFGQPLPNGVYMVRMEAEAGSRAGTIMIVR